MALGTRVQFEQSGVSRSTGVLTGLSERLSDTIDRGVNYLLSLQASEGYWMGELEADTTLESDYIFYLQVINKANPDRIAKLANYVRRRQLETKPCRSDAACRPRQAVSAMSSKVLDRLRYSSMAFC